MTTKTFNRYQVTLMDRKFNVIAIILFTAEDDAAAHCKAFDICWQHRAAEYRVEDAA